MSEETFELCDLCGEHHEMLVDDKKGECPESWAVEHFKQYESMYLKWCDSEKKIQDLEVKLTQAMEKLEEAERKIKATLAYQELILDGLNGREAKIQDLENKLSKAVELIKLCSKPILNSDKMIACDEFLKNHEEIEKGE